MTARTYRFLYKGYRPSFVLGLLCSIFSRSIFLFKDFDKLFKPQVLSEHSIFAFNTTFATLFITKYIKKNLQPIFKMVLEALALLPALITFVESSQEHFFKACFSDIYYRKNHLDCYNFCQQYKNYFTITKTKGLNQIFVTIFFLKNHINFC